MPKVKTRAAHTALKDLVADLKKHNVLGLKAPKPLVDGVSTTGEGWFMALNKTLTEIETWCDANPAANEPPFTIDVPE